MACRWDGLLKSCELGQECHWGERNKRVMERVSLCDERLAAASKSCPLDASLLGRLGDREVGDPHGPGPLPKDKIDRVPSASFVGRNSYW
jgi:hypothetical protein